MIEYKNHPSIIGIYYRAFTNILRTIFRNKHTPYIGALVLIFLIIVATNFPFNTWFTGWDNLHPEFDFLLNLKRAFTAVWQENQGLGTYGGHGYAATLPHTLITMILAVFLPVSLVRSTFTFLMLIIGCIGIYFLIYSLTNPISKSNRAAALIGALFYMLNLSTVQQFYIELEAFIIHFAALPWLIYLTMLFLHKPSKKKASIFAIVSFFTSTQGFIPPLFIVYSLILGIFLFIYVLQNRTLRSLRLSLILVIVTVVVNAYWFFPVAYYTFTRADTYLNAYNNLSSTEDFVLKNQKYGTIQHTTILRGFIFEAIDSAPNGEIVSIFQDWILHLQTPFITFIGYCLFALMFWGLIFSLRKKNYITLGIAVNSFLIFCLLTTNTPPFSYISSLLQNVPVLKQAFRVAFTKFSIALSFFYAILLAFGFISFADFFSRKLRIHNFSKLFGLFFIPVLIIFSFPIFTGHFLYPRTKIQIPTTYFDAFTYLKQYPKYERIANFPQGWNWGWSVYKWGYSGSGFLWYGIEQPLLDRAFDVWGKENENYYWEVNYAVYTENFDLLDKILAKYNVDVIFFDENIVPYPNVKGFLFNDKLENHFDSSPHFSLLTSFPSNDKNVNTIKLYKVLTHQGSNNIPVIKKLYNIGPEYNYSNFDQAYQDYGDYYTDTKNTYDVYYPYRTLFTGRKTDELPAIIEDHSNTISINSNSIPIDIDAYNLYPTGIASDSLKLNTHRQIEDNTMNINFDKIKDYSYSNLADTDFYTHDPTTCGAPTLNPGTKTQIIDQGQLVFSSINSENCYSITLPSLPQRFSYIAQVESQHIEGKPLQMAIINQQAKKSDIDVLLPPNNTKQSDYVILPPGKFDGIGYQFTFNNISIGPQKTSNTLSLINMQPFPYSEVIKNKYVKKMWDDPSQILISSRSYDTGWKAYEVTSNNPLMRSFPFLWGTQLTNHILVNNWANGWKLPANNETNGNNIVIIFLPQYLEYLGFIMLIICFAIIVLSGKKRVIKQESNPAEKSN